MKFDLSKLGSREFENLTQTLAIAEFGSAVTVFGPGPDGGREATFEGNTKFGDNGPIWHGYGVLQAKYCDTLTTPQKDATWLISQIRKEMAEWKTSTKRGNKPEYILFATNVTLSGVPKTGGLDRVGKELASQCAALGIKGWHVWHGESVNRLLEKHPTIRTSYAAWVLPGDILTELYAQVSSRKREVGTALQRYLARELLRDLHVNLDQAGSAEDLQISLADVFIDLPIGPAGDHHSGPAGQVLRTLIDVCDARASKSQSRQSKAHSDRYVLIGGPGQGKSTVSQFLCQLYRTKMTVGTPIGRTNEMTKAIDLIGAHASKEGLTPKAHRWPVKIPLTQLADDLAHQRSKSILQFIASRVSSASNFNVTPHDLREWLGAFPWLVLLDGLDEVPTSSNRDQVISAVNEFMLDIEESSADVVIVATTRPQGYTDDFSPSHFTHLELKPLDNTHALRYGQKLATARHGAASERSDRLMARLRQAAGEASTARLMSSPLQVTIMAVLLDRMGKAPKDRYTLFKDYYRVIYERELEKEGPSTNLLRDHRGDIDTIHADVGLLLQTKSERSGDTESRINLDEFADIIRQRLENEGHTGSILDVLTSSIRLAATDRLVFLVPSRAGEVGFEIRSLQEFWAADALMSARDEDVRNRLREICASAHWRNVLLFSVGKIFADRRHLRDSVVAVVSEMNSYAKDPDMPTRRLLLGSRLAVEILADGMVKAPKHESVLVDLAMKLLGQPAADLLEVLPASLSESGLQTARENIEIWLIETGRVTESLLTFLSTMATIDSDWAVGTLKRAYASSTAETRSNFIEIGFKMGSGHMLGIAMSDLLDLRIPEMLRVCLGRSFRDYSTSPEIRQIPPWFNRLRGFLFEGYQHSSGTASVLDLGVAQLSVEVPRHDEHPLWKDIDLSGIPEESWISKTRDFAKEPSVAALASALAAIRASGASANDMMLRIFPWPIAAALQDVESGQASEGDINKGLLGDHECWQKIENSWVGIMDCRHATSGFRESVKHGAPYLPYLASPVGFIDRLNPKRRSSSALKNLSDALSACGSGYSRSHLAFVALMAVRHGLAGNPLNDDDVVYLKNISEISNDLNEFVDIGWIARVKNPSANLIAWLDQFIKKCGRPIPYVNSHITRAWVADFTLTGLGALVCESDLTSLAKRAQGKIKKEWSTVRSSQEVGADRRMFACVAVGSFFPPSDRRDFDDRLAALVNGIEAGVARPDMVISQINLMHDVMQQKLLLAFLDRVEEVDYETRKTAFDRLVADQTSMLTKIDFSAMRVR
ncbi:hypothetical protein GCM10010495_15120 [Kitasatospora herbaricolor]|uniref:NACHT domain-containing protein n=1 Tax=Kitasatospora herbaricolor TaxID=68217 RepID=UPI00174A387E|nr:hypothetical protein [Kitasatospora herbaricolor]MDQ0309315.1 hypothetical protein [Kitasatospora herbaricolor]GGV04364.1 hypothetical protein GCM10010495_15120 [Kitasatospora herbaricolor]